MVYKNSGNPAVLGQIHGKGKKILDVGCGAGDNARILVSKGHILDGITLSQDEASECQTFMRNVYVHNLETGLPASVDDEYDYVICSHVLEHLAYPKQLLNDIRGRLSDSGVLIVALPNVMHYRPRMRLLSGNFNYEDSGIWDRTHLRWYTYYSGRQLLEENRFKVIKQWVDGEMPVYRITRVITAPIRAKIYRALAAISPGLFGGQLLFLASALKND